MVECGGGGGVCLLHLLQIRLARQSGKRRSAARWLRRRRPWNLNEVIVLACPVSVAVVVLAWPTRRFALLCYLHTHTERHAHACTFMRALSSWHCHCKGDRGYKLRFA